MLAIPTIILAEVRYALVKKGVGDVWDSFLSAVALDRRISIEPLTLEVLKRMPSDLEMHDAIVCATAVVLASEDDDVEVLTLDRNMRDSGVVRTIW